jgi:hypothetical protein
VGTLRFAHPTHQPSSPVKTGDPVFPEAPVIEIEKPRRTGYSAFAEYDDLLWSEGIWQQRFGDN